MFGKKIGGLSVGGWLNLFFVAWLSGAISSYISAPKTNRLYLQEIIKSGMIVKAAVQLVAKLKNEDNDPNISEADWLQIEKGLSDCMIGEANKYLGSDDPYLMAKADMNSPTVLAEKFLRACGAIE